VKSQVLPYLQKEIIIRINEQFENINGMTLEEVALKYGKTKLSQKFGTGLFDEDRINSLLKIANTSVNRFEKLRSIKNKLGTVHISARVSEEYLWLSIVEWH